MSAVKKEHIAFARAVVALAREHKMDGLHLEFHCSFAMRHDSPELFSNERMTMTWAEGRHGAESRINLQCAANTSFDEQGPT